MIIDFEYERDRRWADKFENKLKKELGGSMFETGTYYQDVHQGIDMTASDVSKRIAKSILDEEFGVALRMRAHEYLYNYGNEITLRYSRSSGTPTEYNKWIDGKYKSEYMMYGFASEDDDEIDSWVLTDMVGFRNYHMYMLTQGINLGKIIPNNDNKTTFIAFDLVPLFE